jgi:DNA-binding NarL/FixJ family response regulator
MSQAIRILAVDDHPVVRGGIAALISGQTDMNLVAEASNGREAIVLVREHHPDIVLMDLQMPEMNGLDATMTICAEFPDAKVIVLTTYSGDAQVSRALKAGARAYLLKNLVNKELLAMIRAVHAGKRTLSPEISHQLLEHANDDRLTPAEIDVLRLIAAGKANKEIAAELSTSEEGVKGRVRSILSKLGANDRTHAAMIGIKRGIIEP